MITFDVSKRKYIFEAKADPIVINNELHNLLGMMEESGEATARVELCIEPDSYLMEARRRIGHTLGYYGHKMSIYAGTPDIAIEVAA